VLQPIGWLVRTGEYSRRIDWGYLIVAVAVALLSERRQRKSFYYAGLLNTGAALYWIAYHRHWFDRPAWGAILILIGLAALAAGFLLDRAAARKRAR
jgi:apolipoprotein N-acyltransferase